METQTLRFALGHINHINMQTPAQHNTLPDDLMHKLMMLEHCFGVHYDHPQAQPTEEVLCTVFEGEPVTGSLGACVLHFTTTLQPLVDTGLGNME